MGWVGTAFCVTGAITVGYKHRAGFLFTALGCGFWTVVGLSRGMPDLAAVEAFFMAVSVWSYWNWGRK
jgi:hypothetical protein